MDECMYTRDDLVKAVPYADCASIGGWDDLEQAIDGFNLVIDVIHAEHPCCTERHITDAGLLGNAAYEVFCNNDGDVDATIDFVRSKI